MNRNWSISKRPKTWDDVFGCDNFKKWVHVQAEKGFPNCSVILAGRFGSGKTTTAKIYAASLACKTPKPNGDPCGTCPTCEAIFSDHFNRDVIMINGGTANKDTIVDELSDFVSFPARKDRVKVAIIEEIQELHDKARNAMLKWLETEHVGFHFIMLTMKDQEKTGFSSRSQVFRFNELDTESLAHFLFNFCKKNDIDVPEERLPALFALADAASGSIRVATQNLERAVDTDMWDVEEIERELGSVDKVKQLEVLTALLNGKCDELLFKKLMNEQDFDGVFKFNMNAISAAEAQRTFGVNVKEVAVAKEGYDNMTATEKKRWEIFAAKKAFAMRESVDLLAKHPSFDILRDAFLSIDSSFDTFSEDLKKARYLLLMCEIARKLKAPIERVVRRAVPNG